MRCAMTVLGIMRTGEFAVMCRRVCYRGYSSAEERNSHPYLNIHPWKSKTEFANSMLKNVIYNADGIVAINKPYGIAIRNISATKDRDVTRSCHKIVGAVDYSLEEILPFLAKELDVPALIPCTGSEKYMSGVYIFGTNMKMEKDIILAQRRANQMQEFKKYWAITTRIPNEHKGNYHLGMQIKDSQGSKATVIMTEWFNNMVKRQEVKILNVKYKLISNSTHNVSSLIELSTSTKKWHSVRLFASTMLYAPLLGDYYHGSRVQEIMGVWIKVNPFAESCKEMPLINSKLLELLNIRKSQQEIIPCHTHLRSIFLKSYSRQKKDILIEAPLLHPFDWTCKQLMFKNIPCHDMNDDNTLVENQEQTCSANA